MLQSLMRLQFQFNSSCTSTAVAQYEKRQAFNTLHVYQIDSK